MKELRFKIFLFLSAIFIIISFALEIHYVRHEIIPFPTQIILLLLFNLTFVALLVLIFFIAKSLVKLFFERKHQVPGYKFKTRLVTIFVIITLIPSALLFFIASGLITNYIDRWFIPQIKIPIESSVEIAKTVYENEKQNALIFAREQIYNEKNFQKNYTVKYIYHLPEEATETIKAAFEGKEGAEVVSGDNRDLIRAAVPEYKNGRVVKVVVVETYMPSKITKNAEKINDAYENYLTLESLKVPVKANYLLILGFITTIVVFFALWVALRISRNITDPIQMLVFANQQVSSGNLDVHINLEKEDEMGILINSFNEMVKNLKAGKESIQSAYLYLKNILDNINSGVIMLDIKGEISMINGAACMILGLRHDEVINKNYNELLSKIDSQEIKEIVKSIEGRQFRPVKKQVSTMIGDKKLSLNIFITSLKDNEKYIGMLVVFDDITEAIEAQKALTWQDAAKKIAHEIKNPLTPIKLATERMMKKWINKDKDFEKTFPQSIQTIIKQVDSLKKLVDDFSKYGKMPEIKKKEVILYNIIDEVIHLYYGYKNIKINVSIPDNIPPIELDTEQFKRVLINIFDNAIQAMSGSGVIDVVIDFNSELNNLSVEIADTGTGIQTTDMGRLFQPNFSTRKGGTGLGLAIANRIIKEHGGKITARENIPKGSVFRIEIPIKEI